MELDAGDGVDAALGGRSSASADVDAALANASVTALAGRSGAFAAPGGGANVDAGFAGGCPPTAAPVGHANIVGGANVNIATASARAMLITSVGIGLLRRPAAINDDVGACDESCCLGTQETRKRADFLHLAPPAHGQICQELAIGIGIVHHH
jgi:hypothetical protein